MCVSFFTANLQSNHSSLYTIEPLLGLLADDLIMEELPGVKEALSRLPAKEIDERYFRLKRVCW